jgi:hypothetical protein
MSVISMTIHHHSPLATGAPDPDLTNGMNQQLLCCWLAGSAHDQFSLRHSAVTREL